ncbi:MAG: hypothetical protein MUO62_06905 [Anaerolineales bacterium]|nr:hypothetical protein [Anaerolineales bacterium]
MTNTMKSRQDVRTLWLGLAFSLGITLAIWALDPLLANIKLLPDEGVAWYYWKLPAPTFWTHFSAWGLYFLHQFSLWWIIWYSQKSKAKYTPGLHKFNYWALGINALFIVLRVVQTHIWYDGLAQDVSIFSSQGSVIVLLVWVLLMENKRRGMFMGKKPPISSEIIGFARKYHGYYFAWATVYTFWYHPTVATPAHLLGFFYMFLLLLQGSLFFTRIHVNKYWTFVQEFTVLVHGTIVAVFQGGDLWPMFAYGFGAIFVFTQLYGLGLKAWQRWVFIALYVLSALYVYNGRLFEGLTEIIRIPAIDYILVFVLAGLFWLVIKLMALSKKIFNAKTLVDG